MILQVGSISELVKRLQEFLNIPADGVFGGATQRAVKKWQEENGLIADGVVGPQTWRAMGLATTDSYERYDVGQNVFTYKKKYLPKDEYFQGPTKKWWIFLHHTAGWKIPSIP
jgi:peptidoglycan hydrolase-like protein with peptidoglycan-binding domain